MEYKTTRDSIKKVEVKSLIRSKNLKLSGILDTKTREGNVQSFRNVKLPGWLCSANYGFSDKGRIWVCWDPKVLDYMVVDSSDQAIHGRVRLHNGGQEFIASFV